MTASRLVCVGVFIGAHGVRGQLRLRSFTEDPETIFSYAPLVSETENPSFPVSRVGAHKDHFIVRMKGVDDRDAAEALRGVKLYVSRDALPQTELGTYYEADLIGLAVRSAVAKAEGKIIALHDYGAGSFLEVQPTEGASYMLPFSDACVPEVDVDGGFVRIDVPEGWLEAEQPPEGGKA